MQSFQPFYDSESQKVARTTRVISVTSGKGGVGKTLIASNIAIDMQRRRKKVLLLDADLGLANVDVLLGIRPKYNLFQLLDGEKTLDEIIARGPAGVDILPAGSGIERLTELDENSKLILMERLAEIDGRYDLVIVDTSAGINSNVIYFNLAAHATVVVVTPEPTSRTDAYALIKVLFTRHNQKRFQILINQAGSEAEGRGVYRNLAEVADKHLGDVYLGYLGCLTHDKLVGESIRLQRAAIEQFPESKFAEEIHAVATRVANLQGNALDLSMGLFWRRLFSGTQSGGGVR